MSEDQWQAFRQYEEEQRKLQADREREALEKRQREIEEAARQQALRELQRRATEHRQSMQKEAEQNFIQMKRQHAQEMRHTEDARQAAELKQIDLQRNLLLGEAHKRMEAIRARRPAPPYDTFSEQFFHEAWKRAYPYIELVPQRPIGPFRADFAHEDTQTVIELNGSIHGKRRIRNRDAPRHRYLESMGWHVLPFTNDEINYYMSACIEEVFATITERQGR